MKKLSWEDVSKAIAELAEKIKASGFEPDYLVGITTGGLVPLYFLSKKLDINKILTISARSYDKDQQKELKISYLPEADMAGKNILLIDEVAETGASLKGVVEAVLSKYKPAGLKTVTIGVNEEKCEFYPDFWAVSEKGWIVFPWEKEDFPEYF